jgi:fatty-acyl-CoA synthase
MLARGAARDGAVTAVGPAGATSTTWGDIHRRARRLTVVLRDLGIGPGKIVYVVGFVSLDLVATIQACMLSGATLSVLPTPLRVRSRAAQAADILRFVSTARPDVVLADREACATLAELRDEIPLTDLDELARRAETVDEDGGAPGRRPADAPLLLQFTSGSTTEPRAVIVTEVQLLAHVEAIVDGAGIHREGETVVSWLPLYHDMGLIGFLLIPMLYGFELVVVDPVCFVLDPGSWMRLVSEHRATVTGAPGFAYGVAAKHLTRSSEPLDLGSVRLAFNGAEPIVPGTVETFLAASADHGFTPGAMFCVYGLAEATLAVSFPPPGRGMRVDVVDAAVLESRRTAVAVPDGRRLVRLGGPLPGVELRIVDPATGAALPERSLGEVQVAGVSVTPGYVGDGSEQLFDGRWLRTGDLGYLGDGELVIGGRIKDVIIVGGRNIFPVDIERVVGALPGVRTGGVVAFGAPAAPDAAGPGAEGVDGVVVVAEHRSPGSVDARQVVEAVWSGVGVAVRDVVLVPPGAVPMTTSGKPRRAMCRRLHAEGRLPHDQGP